MSFLGWRRGGGRRGAHPGRGFAAAVGGNVAVIFGMMAPVLLFSAGVAIDFASWTHQRERLKGAADSAALAATRELSITAANQERVEAIARSVVLSHLNLGQGDPPVEVKASIKLDRSGVSVSVTQPRRAGLSQAVAKDPEVLGASGTATMSGNRKVCVVGLDTGKSKTISLDAQAKLTALGCAVFSNSKDKAGIEVKDASLVTADLICSVGGIEGGLTNIAGQRMTDCPAQADPLAQRPPPTVGACKDGKAEKLVIESDRTLLPGTYCGGIEIKKSSKVTLSDGIFVIKDGQLKVDDTATLYGRNVGVHFTGKDANFDFLSSSTVNLGAPVSGPMAGILFYGDREADEFRKYKITSDNARTLLGTIYLPKGYLEIDANNPVADQSAYTAIVTSRIELKKAPNLVLNTNYAATDVPVPQGLGPTSNLRLER